MWKWLARRHLERAGARKGPILEQEIADARSVLFAVFARYGDGVIAFKLIREFVKHYPDKRYRLLTTPQALPYAQALLAGVAIEIVGFNKRTSWLTILRTLVRLRRHPPDIGYCAGWLRAAFPSVPGVCALPAQPQLVRPRAPLPRTAICAGHFVTEIAGKCRAHRDLSVLNRCAQGPRPH